MTDQPTPSASLPTNLNWRDVLAFYVDAGVDIALQDEPIDRFEQVAQTEKAKAAAAPAVAQQKPRPSSKVRGPAPTPAQPLAQATVPDENAVQRAVDLAASAKTLEELNQSIAGFDGCNLKFSARNTVFADGKPGSPLMLIGEVPGRDEDEQGLPFVGSPGQLLNRMLSAIGLDRDGVYIANIIPWRPPGNRAPTPAEVEICRPFIERHIQLAAPKMVLLMGGAPAKTLLRTKSEIMRLRGKWTNITIGESEIPVMATLHPSYLLRTLEHKRLAWNDLLTVQQKLTELKVANAQPQEKNE